VHVKGSHIGQKSQRSISLFDLALPKALADPARPDAPVLASLSQPDD
jgi:hypothetical protein